MNKDILLKTENLKKSYQINKDIKIEVLKGINLEIYKGEVLAIVGKSGTGKSTLLHLLGTLDRPDSGKVLFEDKNIFDGSESKLAKFRNSKIGFIFQFHHLLPEFSALENVMIASMIGGKNDKTKAVELLREVGLEQRKDHKPSELSGGESQRVAIARSLVNSPAIILADEPTGNLDTENSESVMNLIFSIREKLGVTFVIVTHNEEFARKCDRIIRMQDGMIIEQ